MTPHSQRLERWLGVDVVENLSRNMAKWYGPPIAVAGVPGAVFATSGGDFIGEYRGSVEVSAVGRAMELLRLIERQRFQRRFHQQRGSFTGLSALITAKTAGNSVTMFYNKQGTSPTAIGGAIDLWGVGVQPAAGAAGAAAPTGTSPTLATTGALGFVNAVSNANTSHFVNSQFLANVAPVSLLLYDRLLMVAKTMSSTVTEAVTGTFSRYQSTTENALAYAGGSFVFPRCSAALSATAHNWTVCQYTNEDGTATQSIPSVAGISSCAANQVDLALGQWFMPLSAGDVGVQALSQMQCSASVTGTLDFVVGHPIALMGCLIANVVINIDGVTSAFNLQQVYDNACLSLMQLPMAQTNATTFTGTLMTVSE
jgi:hypothetical protein